MSCLWWMCRVEGGLAGLKLESRVSLILETRLRGHIPGWASRRHCRGRTPQGPWYMVSEPWSPCMWKERGLKPRVC